MNSMVKTLTIAHDAGGAEMIAAWCKAHPEEGPFLHVASGPAVRAFEKRGLNVQAPGLDMEDQLQGVTRVVAGPGWNSPLEFEFIKTAKRMKIPTVVYLDHWMNYRLRFGYPRDGWEENLPDEIWVGDEAALRIAQEEFPGMAISLVPNEHMHEIRESFSAIQSKVKEESDLVLFLSEPMSEPTTIFGDLQDVSFDEFGVLQDLISRVKGSTYRLVVRMHPSESKEKYQSFGVKISDEPELLTDLARASVIVGMSTMALAHAAACGKKVWSLWPDVGTSSPPLPVPGIKTVSRAGEIALP
ncbi:hypothetical protein IT087_00430 [Candidatus Uhrbacteria bacterium]|nr:hypothetical protein [Candidatus Uhrbacteria bacterium]